MKRQPDLELKCNMGIGFDVVAIKVKRPTAPTRRAPKKEANLERLKGCSVAALVSNDYDAARCVLHARHKAIAKKRIEILDIEDQPMQIDFARNDNPNKRCNKLPTEENLLTDSKCRGMGP